MWEWFKMLHYPWSQPSAHKLSPGGKLVEMGSKYSTIEFHMGHFAKLAAVIASAHFIQPYTHKQPLANTNRHACVNILCHPQTNILYILHKHQEVALMEMHILNGTHNPLPNSENRLPFTTFIEPMEHWLNIWFLKISHHIDSHILALNPT